MVRRGEVPDLDLELVFDLLVLASLAELELGGIRLAKVFRLPSLGRAVVEVPQLHHARRRKRCATSRSGDCSGDSIMALECRRSKRRVISKCSCTRRAVETNSNE